MPAAENAAKSSARVADRSPANNSTAAFSAMREGRLVQPQFAMTGAQRLQGSVGRQLEHPADVFGGDHVQRAAHRPGPDDVAAVEGIVHVLDR